eukprot:15436030-Alexandrium_andersonii.AAC.1
MRLPAQEGPQPPVALVGFQQPLGQPASARGRGSSAAKAARGPCTEKARTCQPRCRLAPTP